jgi:hypothetical protein
MTTFRSLAVCCLLACMACKNTPKPEILPEDLFVVQYASIYELSDSSGLMNMMIHLDDNGTYSHFASNFYNYGTWKFVDSSKGLILKPESGYPLQTDKFVFELEKIKAGRQLEMYHMVKDGDEWVRSTHETVMGSNNKGKAKPFDAANHEWRKKPVAPETPEQIKSRVRKYFLFLKDYFQYCEDNQLEAITFGWFPAPLQMHYANGIRMAYNTELNDWYKCFYNEEQGIEAYKLVGAAMQKSKLNHKETKAERNMDMVEQLLEHL